MTYKEETYVIRTLKRIRDETYENNLILKENNKLLKTLLEIEKARLINAHKENEDDFGRNVLANLLSTQLELFNKH